VVRGIVRPRAREDRAPPLPGGRRLVIVQLDGVSRARLARALADDALPALAARLRSGGHVLSSCRSGAPASTPSFQAGLFYGVSPSLPAFAWFDRATGREVRMDRIADATAVEAQLARNGPGLLRGGSAYFSILSGEAAHPHFCLSGLGGGERLVEAEAKPGGLDTLALAFVHSVTAARGALRLAEEIGEALVDGIRWSAALGRMRHEPRFLLHRLLGAAAARELAVQGLLADLSRGIPALYIDLLGFDESAHRRGPDSLLARRNLLAADAVLAAIFAAVEAAPELGYDVYVLSDHGHVATRPFEELAGAPLPDFVAAAERGGPLPRRSGRSGPSGHLLGGRAVRAGRAGPIATAEAGDLAHVYFLDHPGPLPLPAIQARHPRALAALARSDAVGLLAARGGRRGYAIAGGPPLDLADPRDLARFPHPDPVLAATYVSDLLSLRESGDLVVLGWRGEARTSVAYAWEFGSHGGIAPEELASFVVHPAACGFDFGRVLRPSELNGFFERAYRAPPAETAAGLAAGATPRGATP
jgi:hypothetical protein